jgi:hypothetical protein
LWPRIWKAAFWVCWWVMLPMRWIGSENPTHKPKNAIWSEPVEGLAWVFREHVMDAAEGTFGLEPDEQHVLAEMAYSVSDQGKIYGQQRFIPFLAMIRLIARIGERVTSEPGPPATIDFSGSDWDNFRKSLAIRNRITHPKSRSDLVLTDDDIATSLAALFWFLTNITVVMAATNKAFRGYLGQLDEVSQLLLNGDPATLALYEKARQELS